MSHSKQRSEKNCLNCNAHVYGRYCHICGQENIEAKHSFWSLVTHFFYDVTHFDGKFFSTLKYLLFRPGFLSKEFLRGRRASYLDPIRMYVFTSAIFFLIFFSFVASPPDFKNLKTTNSKAALQKTVITLQQSLKQQTDPVARKILENEIQAINNSIKRDSLNNDTLVTDNGVKVTFMGSNLPSTVDAYDSIQNKLPPDKRDGFFKHRASERAISISEEYREDKNEFYKDLFERFQHALPQMMFLSLPLVALILELLYIRRRKNFYYVSHGIFALHVYIAIYILLLFIYFFGGLHNSLHWQIFSWLTTLTECLIVFYIYKAMRNFYAQGRIKTLAKMILFSGMYLCVLIFLISIFFFILLMQI